MYRNNCHSAILKSLLLLIIAINFIACNNKLQVDLIIKNGKIYTVDSTFSISEAVAINDGKIIFVGDNTQALEKFQSDSVMDINGAAVFPGFIDPHCHFYNYGYGLQQCDLVDTKSWENIIQKLILYAKQNPEGWIFGRGWDQNDWSGSKEFPTNDELNKLFPTRPVMLTRIDGHAAIVNDYLLQTANISANTKINGGKIISLNNKPTGVLIDNAIDLIPTITDIEKNEKENLGSNQQKNFNADNFILKALLGAQKNCFEVGLTSICDAGLSVAIIKKIDSLQKNNILKMRINAMASNTKENFNYFFKHGKIETDRLKVCAFKIYGDGALGSRGACLLEPYSDKPQQTGFLLFNVDTFKQQIKNIYSNGFQACTHAIGDSANRLVLKAYAEVLKSKNDKRWRIEHAQIVNPNDLAYFKKFNIIPSIQTTHATSDMYWAEERIGKSRIQNAYAYKDLLNSTGIVANGSDFPVENINPLFGFYAATVRKDQKDFPSNGYFINQALSRIEALKAMTIWAAYACFEDIKKGSLEKGKFADFVILDNDIMTIDEKELYKVKVNYTFINGEKVYQRK
jgi:predicted amidohydrolase YtcJ